MPSKRSSPELLAVSFSYPPLAYPRSVQVARLLKHLKFRTVLVCADERGARLDPTIEPDAEAHLRACLRLPFSIQGWRKQVNRVSARLGLPLWNKRPDEYVSWKPGALKAVKDYAQANAYAPDLVVTFGQPMSDHLVGLELKKLYGVPWVAHFSDPWTDNPFNRYDSLTRRVNLSLERKVMQTADRLIFTSAETIDLVMAKYPVAWRDKARVLPHSFDSSLYPSSQEDSRPGITIRYIGEFYGKRTPAPLIQTLRAMLAANPQLLEGVCFESIGPLNPETLAGLGLEELPEGLVHIRPSVNYEESLRLAATANGLLIIDAPAKRSVFLPSKLIDYIGAARPILAFTPQGTAASVIEDLGGWVADPTNLEAMKKALKAFLMHLSQTRDEPLKVWGEPQIREAYEASVVADSFENMLRELLT
ncbi:MAG TPA: glycosyltransferase [Pyrinomonadaceae bacterium]|nr:glycosyltransferase [Pyrinomonadaceae bacterium]